MYDEILKIVKEFIELKKINGSNQGIRKYQTKIRNLISNKNSVDLIFTLYRILRDQDAEIFKVLYNQLMHASIDDTNKIVDWNPLNQKIEKAEILEAILMRLVIRSNTQGFKKFFEVIELNKAMQIFAEKFYHITVQLPPDRLLEIFEIFKEKYAIYIQNIASLNDQKLKIQSLYCYTKILQSRSKDDDWKSFVTKVHLENGYQDEIYKYFMDENRQNLLFVVKNSDTSLLNALINFYGVNKIFVEDNISLWRTFLHKRFDPIGVNDLSMLNLLYSNLPKKEISYCFDEAEFKKIFEDFLICGNWIVIDQLLNLYEERSINNGKDLSNGKFHYSLIDIIKHKMIKFMPISHLHPANEDLNLRNKIAFDNLIGKIYFNNPCTWDKNNYRPYAHLEFFLKAFAWGFINCSQIKSFISCDPVEFVNECMLENELDISIILLNNIDLVEYVFSLFNFDQKAMFLQKFCSAIEDKTQIQDVQQLFNQQIIDDARRLRLKYDFNKKLTALVLQNLQIFDCLDIYIPHYLNQLNPVNDAVSVDLLRKFFGKPQSIALLKGLPYNKIVKLIDDKSITDFLREIIILKGFLYIEFKECVLSRLNNEDQQKVLKALLNLLITSHYDNNGLNLLHEVIDKIQDKNFVLNTLLQTNYTESNIQGHVKLISQRNNAYYLKTMLKAEILKIQTAGNYDAEKIEQILSIIDGAKAFSKTDLVYSDLSDSTKLMLSKVFLYDKSYTFGIFNMMQFHYNLGYSIRGIYLREDILRFISQFPKTLQILYDNNQPLCQNNLPDFVSEINNLTLALATRQSSVLTPNWDGLPKEIRAKITEYLNVNYDEMLALRQRAKAKVISHRAALESEQCKEPANHKRKRDDSDNENPPKKIAKTI
ncbi:MAG: hypothetical protein J0G32_08515 [Alphaproteobacteria bacterium]|nr:hypothetical protein [Alphaproteobacteria bacterium]